MIREMADQASVLRQLVRQAGHGGNRWESLRPRLLVVSSVLPGAGATSLAVNLSVALAARGQRVVLADADGVRPAVGRWCDLETRVSLADVWAGRHELAEILQPGPAGVLIAAGRRTPAAQGFYRPASQRRLLAQLARLGEQVDWVLLDSGSAADATVERFWRAADQVALVLTPEAAAVLAAYTRIKQAVGARRPTFGLIINRVADRQVAVRVQRCLEWSCRRFLNTRIAWWGQVREDPGVSAAARPVADFQAGGPAGNDVQVLAGQIAASGAARAGGDRVIDQETKKSGIRL